MRAWGFTCIEKTDRIPNICLTLIKIFKIQQIEYTKYEKKGFKL